MDQKKSFVGEYYIPSLQEMSIENFIKSFHNILEWKKKNNWNPYYDNPSKDELLQRARWYGSIYKNGSFGWTSNIWSRSKANTSVVEDNSQLTDEHKILMLRSLEYVLAPNPLIKVDGNYGANPRVAMHTTIYNDGRYPDLANGIPSIFISLY